MTPCRPTQALAALLPHSLSSYVLALQEALPAEIKQPSHVYGAAGCLGAPPQRAGAPRSTPEGRPIYSGLPRVPERIRAPPELARARWERARARHGAP